MKAQIQNLLLRIEILEQEVQELQEKCKTEKEKEEESKINNEMIILLCSKYHKWMQTLHTSINIKG